MKPILRSAFDRIAQINGLKEYRDDDGEPPIRGDHSAIRAQSKGKPICPARDGAAKCSYGGEVGGNCTFCGKPKPGS